MRGSAKDHKSNFDPNFGPDLRPIMGAKVGPNTGLSQIGCKILDEILERKESKKEVKSTEEMMALFKNYNDRLNEAGQQAGKSKTIGSMDIESFYPSIEPNRAAEICKLMFMKSEIEIQNVDLDSLAKYVGKYASIEKIEQEGIKDFIYTKRRKKMRKKISRKANRSKSFRERNIEKKTRKQKEHDLWQKPEKQPSSFETKKLIGIALEMLIITCMTNHLYKFNGQRRLQKKRWTYRP